MKEIFVVTYRGHFGFIKPWTAVRDTLTYSQQFLTPSIIQGMEKKLFPDLLKKESYEDKIVRHKLQYNGINQQQEQTQTRGWKKLKQTGKMKRERSILKRGIMLQPILKLGFLNQSDAEIAKTQYLCLCRNEDLIYPDEIVEKMTMDEFDHLDGFELRFEKKENSFIVGYNRFKNNEPMYGWLDMKGILYQRNKQ